MIHLGQVGPFSSEQILRVLVTFREFKDVSHSSAPLCSCPGRSRLAGSTVVTICMTRDRTTYLTQRGVVNVVPRTNLISTSRERAHG